MLEDQSEVLTKIPQEGYHYPGLLALGGGIVKRRLVSLVIPCDKSEFVTWTCYGRLCVCLLPETFRIYCEGIIVIR